jgi:PAS domain S-box-containing protein
LDNILNNIGDPIFVKDDQHRMALVNDSFCSTFGRPREEIIGKTLVEDVPPNEQDHFLAIDRQVLMDGKENACEELLTVKSGKTLTILTKKTRYVDENGDKFIIGVIRDITERKRAEEEHKKLEAQLIQTQKMEAIGTLAGGIAHDFNNILGAIIGYTEMARDDSLEKSSVVEDLDKVLESSDRAVGLVKQILSFSRQGDTEHILLQPAIIANKAILMLRPTLPTTIEITQDINAKTGLIFADPTQIHQILMNLCTNAFHAMEKTGGRLDISLKEIDLRDGDLSHEPDVIAGTFIQISVGDSGAGMTQEVKDKLFDPYFTTKGVGKGTGMGLSIVHGIIKSYGGFITLSSEPGKGTVFHVFLPVVNKEELPAREAPQQIPVGVEKILFIDDEDVLADMGKNMLERLGYHVTARKSSLEALETFQNQPDQFDVVITDQTMPGMTGIDLARRMLQIRPGIPIILCTGYSSLIDEESAKNIGIKEFALKPLTKEVIARLIRKVLGEVV